VLIRRRDVRLRERNIGPYKYPTVDRTKMERKNTEKQGGGRKDEIQRRKEQKTGEQKIKKNQRKGESITKKKHKSTGRRDGEEQGKEEHSPDKTITFIFVSAFVIAK